MGLRVPNTVELEVINQIVGVSLTIRLYGNNKTPGTNDIAANYTEIAGGGYTNKPLVFAGWDIVAGTPSAATYDTTQTWTFTGVINAPGTIYGYYVTRNSDGKLMWSERFPAANVPFSPVAGSVIKVLPRFSAESQF